ncbi:hypothetical protein ABPG74_021016 [Tetrahymena malaccensis]
MKIFCLTHNQLADFICLNRECKSKKIICPACTQEDKENKSCLELHKEDVLVISDLSEQKFSQTYDSIREQFLKEDEYLFRQMAVLNKFKFEHLGRDFYYFLLEQSLKGLRSKQDKLNTQNFDELVGYNASSIKFTKIIEDFTRKMETNLTQIQDNKLDSSQIIDIEKLAINNLADEIQLFTNGLVNCQSLFENMSCYQETYSDSEIENLFKKLKKIVQDFVDKKLKKKNKKKKFPQDEISKFESKLLENEQDIQDVIGDAKDIQFKQEISSRFYQTNQQSLEQITLKSMIPETEFISKTEEKSVFIKNEDSHDTSCSKTKQDNIIPLSSTESIVEIEDLKISNENLDDHKCKYVKLLNKIQLKSKNKIYRLRLSPNQKQLSVTCGGWNSSQGDCLLYDLDFYQSDLLLKKIINFGQYKFIDSAFSPCGDFIFLTANNKIFVYKSEYQISSKNIDKKPVLKISTTYEVRAIDLQSKIDQRGDYQKENELIVAVGGNCYFELLAVKLNQYDNQYSYNSDFIAVVQGQVENIKFCFNSQFIAFTVYETQQISLFDVNQKQICYISQPLGFFIWNMQIDPCYGFVAISGESSQIYFYSLDLLNYQLSMISTIETQFSGIITAFDFFKNYLFISCSDDTLKIYEQKSKLQSNEVYYEKIYSSSPLLHKMPTLVFCPVYKQIITGCKNGKLLRWQFSEDQQENLQC